jgi:intracellular sulfur oxidation DsrE/DsrF family protein
MTTIENDRIDHLLNAPESELLILLGRSLNKRLGAKEKNKNELINSALKWIDENKKNITFNICHNSVIKKIISNNEVIKNLEVFLLILDSVKPHFERTTALIVTSIVLHRGLEVFCSND